MAIVQSTLGTPSSTPGTMVAPLTAGTPSISPSVVQTPLLKVIITTTNIVAGSHVVVDVTATCLSVDITYGLDAATSSCTLELSDNPNVPGVPTSNVGEYSLIRVYCSGGSTVGNPYNDSGTAQYNFNGIPLRFTGILLRIEASLWPPTYTLVCRGMLYMASQLRIPPFLIPGTTTVIPAAILENIPIGILLYTNINTQNPVVNGLLPGPSTDVAAITAILQLVVAAAVQAKIPGGLIFNPADILGVNSIPGNTAVFGNVVPLEFLWAPYRSAADIINQFDQICLGFRTHDKYSGKIGRSQIFGYPAAASFAQFTEGIDVWEGSSGSRSIEQLCNASFVEGSAVPSGFTGIINAYVQESNPFQPTSLPVIEQFSSPWIEASNLIVTGGLNANDVANWRLTERNRELVTGQWITYRDDILFPGQTVNVNSPHTAVTENVWIQRVQVKLTADPVSFTQTFAGLGGGDPNFGPSPGFTQPSAY